MKKIGCFTDENIKEIEGLGGKCTPYSGFLNNNHFKLVNTKTKSFIEHDLYLIKKDKIDEIITLEHLTFEELLSHL